MFPCTLPAWLGADLYNYFDELGILLEKSALLAQTIREEF